MDNVPTRVGPMFSSVFRLYFNLPVHLFVQWAVRESQHLVHEQFTTGEGLLVGISSIGQRQLCAAFELSYEGYYSRVRLS
jgi:hypothetical protein